MEEKGGVIRKFSVMKSECTKTHTVIWWILELFTTEVFECDSLSTFKIGLDRFMDGLGIIYHDKV